MVRIITDSSCDLTPEQAARLNVHVVALGVTFEDGTSYRDRVELSPEEFYRKLAACDKLPTTSQPPFSRWADLFEEAQEAGDDVVAVLLSGELSGTIQGARAAADLVGYPGVHIVDSQAAALSLNLLVRLAARLRDSGRTAAQIAETLEEEKKRVRPVALIDDLKYLHKGGRLPATVAVAGNLLGIKPVIILKDGKVKLAGKGRGLPGAYVSLFKLIDSEGGIDPDSGMVVGYTQNPRGAEPIQQYLTGNPKLPAAPLCHVGPAIGTHTGPRCAGIAFFAREN